MAIVVVGAGVTGLTVAERLLKAGRDVLVLEKAPEPGGLCRSYQYGDFIFDIGPHRLFSSNARIQDYFRFILDEEYSFTSRDSMVYMNRKYLTWPLSYSAVFHLPPADMFRCLRDLVLTDHRAEMEIRNLEDDIVARYGQTIYKMFWKDYTEKFLRIPCTRVNASWGNLSVKRSVVDGRTQPLNLMALIRNCLIPRKQELSFIYPNGGMGVFPRSFTRKIEKSGGKVLLSQSVERILTRGDTITGIEANGVAYPVESLVWTGLLPDICALLQIPPPGLRYLSTLLYNLEVDQTYPGKWQWIYFPDKQHIFSRISMPARFSETTVPPGKSGLCVEVSCMAGDERWTQPEALREQVLRDLTAVGLVRDRARISGCHLERVPNTYPIYETGFAARAQEVQGRLAKYRNLHLVGRQASFVHDNIDESVENALQLAERLMDSTSEARRHT